MPNELGQTTVESPFMKPYSIIHWNPEEPDSDDDLRLPYGYDCDNHQTVFNERRLQHEIHKSKRDDVVNKLMQTPLPLKFVCHTVQSDEKLGSPKELRDFYKANLDIVCKEASGKARYVLKQMFSTLGIVRFTETISHFSEWYSTHAGGYEDFITGSLSVVFVDRHGRMMIQQFDRYTSCTKQQFIMYKPTWAPKRVEIHWREVDEKTYEDTQWFGIIARGMDPILDAEMDKKQLELEEIERKKSEHRRQKRLLHVEIQKRHASVVQLPTNWRGMKPRHGDLRQKRASRRKKDYQRNFQSSH
jgi:hypothetical protein